jgi:hypothetical protein
MMVRVFREYTLRMPTFELVSEVRNRDDTEHSGAVHDPHSTDFELRNQGDQAYATVFSPLVI